MRIQTTLICNILFFLALPGILFAQSPDNLLKESGLREWAAYGESSIAEDSEQSYQADASIRLETNDQGLDIASMYRYVTLPPGKRYEVSFKYKVSSPMDDAIVLSINFNKKDGENGSAGSESFNLPRSNGKESWQEFTTVVSIPEDTEVWQIVLSVKTPALPAWFADVTIMAHDESSSSQLSPTSAPPSLKAELNDQWKAIEPLSTFWKADQESCPATIPTEVRMTYDNKNLYVLIVNAEPHPENIKKLVTTEEGGVWNDDSNEILIAVPGGEARQFSVSASGAKWDGVLFQENAGDVYKSDSKWNGHWKSAVSIGKNHWISQWEIPFSDIGIVQSSADKLKINFARHRQAGEISEISMWNRYSGVINDVHKFGTLAFGDNYAKLTRFIEEVVGDPLQIDRAQRVFTTLLSGSAGYYITGEWGPGFHLTDYNENFQKKFTQAEWQREQVHILQEFGDSGMNGPYLPWVADVGWNRLKMENERSGMRFPYALNNSSYDREAIKRGATYVDERENDVTLFDPIRLDALLQGTKSYFQQTPQALPLTLCIDGVDEPTNPMLKTFSRTLQKNNGEVLDKVDEEIRKTVGAGKFGLYDYSNPKETSTSDAAWRRIAFVRWWNKRAHAAAHVMWKEVKQLAPDTPFAVFNANTVAGPPLMDVSLLFQDSDWVSADPYPAATLAIYGRARALYHTGFTTKFFRDLTNGMKTRIFLQGFNYHNRTPTKENLREWTSQALKNGADILFWYTWGPVRLTHPEVHAENLNIFRQVHKLQRIQLPTETKTVIFYSFTTHAALNDEALHSVYTLYSLLGEKIGSWFQFVSDTQVTLDKAHLDSSKMIYISQASYLQKSVAKSLLDHVKAGANLVIFDPNAFQFDDEGGELSEIRLDLIGGELLQKRQASQLTTVGDVVPNLPKDIQLPLTPMMDDVNSDTILAFDIMPPKDAKIFATYEDGKPAAFVRKVGKGSVIYFAAQPFGNSDLVMKESQWSSFFQILAKNMNEATDLPIWKFYLESQS